MRELTATQITTLERIMAHGFVPMMIRLYPNLVGIRRGNYGLLLEPNEDCGWRVFGEACYLFDDNLGVLLHRQDGDWFVWKHKQVKASSQTIAELKRFGEELRRLLDAPGEPG